MSQLPGQKTSGLAITSLVLGCFFLIPLIGFVFGILAVLFGIIALVTISNNRQTSKGGGLAITGIILGVIGIIIVPIIALLAAIAIPNLLRAKLSANEAQAQATVRTIATAAISYSAGNGRYPQKDSDLAYANPPYISQSYDGKTVQGYVYSVKFTPNGYVITASPDSCYVTGVKIFTMKDGQLSESKCQSAEGTYEGSR
jgi:type II secretory pathway pseudopilin PulG